MDTQEAFCTDELRVISLMPFPDLRNSDATVVIPGFSIPRVL